MSGFFVLLLFVGGGSKGGWPGGEWKDGDSSERRADCASAVLMLPPRLSSRSSSTLKLEWKSKSRLRLKVTRPGMR